MTVVGVVALADQKASMNAASTVRTAAPLTALRTAGKLLPNTATSAPKKARIETHSIIEPSWFPQTLVSR